MGAQIDKITLVTERQSLDLSREDITIRADDNAKYCLWKGHMIFWWIDSGEYHYTTMTSIPS